LCGELAKLMNLPACEVELATWQGMPGSISLNVRPHGWALHGGGVFLAEVDDRYRPKSSTNPAHNRVGHTLANVDQVLNGKLPPPHLEKDWMTPMDVFFGFLLFDAWVANQDRHEMNWAVLEAPDGDLALSPSFDHGAAMGSGIEDPARLRYLKEGLVESWCHQGMAQRFEDGRDVTLIQLAQSATAFASSAAVEYWVGALLAIEPRQWQQVLDRLELSETARRFCDEVLRINQGRIRDEFQRP
jgi:hypothetical protein